MHMLRLTSFSWLCVASVPQGLLCLPIPQLSLKQWGVFPPEAHLTKFPDLFGYESRWYLVGRARDVVKHPTVHRMPPQRRIIRAKVSGMPKLGDPALKSLHFSALRSPVLLPCAPCPSLRDSLCLCGLYIPPVITGSSLT